MPLLPHMSESSQDSETQPSSPAKRPSPPSASPDPSDGSWNPERLVVTGKEVCYSECPGNKHGDQKRAPASSYYSKAAKCPLGVLLALPGTPRVTPRLTGEMDKTELEVQASEPGAGFPAMLGSSHLILSKAPAKYLEGSLCSQTPASFQPSGHIFCPPELSMCCFSSAASFHSLSTYFTSSDLAYSSEGKL